MRRLVLGLAAAALAFPAPLTAQAAPPRGQLVEIVRFNVEPSEGPAFEAAIRKVREAAQQAKLDDAWHFWQDGWSYVLAYPVPNMAYFDDPMAFQKQFKGTPGEATVEQAFQEMEAVTVRVTPVEVVEAVPGWEHAPAAAPQEIYFGQVNEFWVKPGKERQFDALVKDFLAFFRDLDYGYQVVGHRVHFGDTQRVGFLTLVDNMSSYYGAKGLDQLIQQHGATQRWQELLGRLAALIDRSESSTIAYRADMSYMAPLGS